MKKIIISSINKSAGKTSFMVGLGKVLGKSIGYIKPFGDRLLYKKKRLWDYDSALVTSIFNLNEKPEEMSIGFEHAKLRYMYDEDGTKKKLNEIAALNGKGKDVLFIETGADVACGVSVHLDPISLARNIGGKLIFVVSGNEDRVIDEVAFVKKYIDIGKVDFAGVVINKVHDVEDFKNTYLGHIEEIGVKVLGVIPKANELTYLTMDFLSNCLFAKVLTAEQNLNNVVKKIYVGAMSAASVLATPLFKTENKLVITSGDRSDMLIAALETNSAGIILTNNILPSPTILSKAVQLGVPMLLVPADTFQVAKQIEEIEPLLTKEATDKIKIVADLVKKYVDTKAIF